MEDATTRSSGLVGSAIGCDYLLRAEMYGFTTDDLLHSKLSIHLAAYAAGRMGIWSQAHDDAVRAALAEGPRLLPIARELLGCDVTREWFSAIDRKAQLWLAPIVGAVAPEPEVAPLAAPTDLDRYAQRPVGALTTSTEIDGTTSLLAAAVEGAGDWDGILRPPLVCYRLTASADARVYSIDSAADWRRLCVAFPAAEPGGFRGGLLTPDFRDVAREWDAVHLTLGGLLSAEQVRLDGPEGRTELLGWEAEQTVWLRWSFEEGTRLPDIPEPVHSPLR